MVEDNPGDQFLLSELLTSAGFNKDLLLTAPSFADAVDILKSQPVDITLLDLSLPDSEGIDTFINIKDLAAEKPVIILSGTTNTQLALDAITMGAQDYLIKGDFDEKLLSKTILYGIERANSLRIQLESDERYRLLSKATNDMIWDWNLLTGKVTRSAEGWRKLFKSNDSDAVIQEIDWYSKIHPEDVASVRDADNRVIQSTDLKVMEVEFRIIRDDGSVGYIKDRGFLIRNAEGKPVRFIGAAQDITEKKEAELTLANSEKRFRTLIENSSDGLIIMDAAGTPLDISLSAQRILQYSSEEFLEHNVCEMIHPDFKQDITDMLLILTKVKDASISKEHLYKRGDGVYIWIECTFHNQLHEPAVNAIVINFKDVSQRKKAEEELKKLSLIARQTSNAVVITDDEGKIIWINEAFTKITEFEFYEIIGKTPGHFLQGAGTSPVVKRYMHIKIANRLPFECDVLNYTKSGREFWFRIEGQPQINEDGKLIGYFAIQTDITNEKNAEYLIKKSEEKYKNLFDFNPSSLIIWDMETFKVLEVNNKAVEEYGYTKEEFLNITLFDFRRPSEYEKIKSLASSFRENKTLSFKGVWEHLKKNREPMLMNFSSHVIDYGGKPAVLALGENITAKVKLEKAFEEERNKKQFEITEAVISAQERERKEIGGELHDNVNQILAGSLLYLGLAKAAGPSAPGYLAESEKLVNAAIYEVRNLSHSLIPPHLAESDLGTALKNILKITADSGMKVHEDFSELDESQISQKLKLAIYRITQEQVNNIQKHSGAKNIYITVSTKNKLVQLIIKDDGVGFDTNKKSKGVGLMNIKTRASMFESKVSIRSSPSKGCELNIVFDPNAIINSLNED